VALFNSAFGFRRLSFWAYWLLAKKRKEERIKAKDSRNKVGKTGYFGKRVSSG
jgi:hypothetical protein